MENIFRRRWQTWLFGIVLLSAALRFYQLGALSFVADEYLDVNSSYGYAQTGTWQAWNFDFGRPDTDNVNVARDERASLYKWQVAQVFRHFAPTEATARSVSAAWGVVTTLLVYFVATYFSKRREVGLVAAFLYAVGASGLETDRKLRMYAMFVPVFLAFWWMAYRFLEEPYEGRFRPLKEAWRRFGFNFLYLVPVAVLGALALSLHLLTVNIVAVVLVYAAVMGHRKWRETGRPWNKYAFVWAAFVVGVVVLRLISPTAYELMAASLGFPDNHYGYLDIILGDYAQFLPALMVYAVGTWSVLRRERPDGRSWWLALSFPTVLFLAVFVWKRNVGAQYIAFAEPLKVIVMAAGVYTLAVLAREHIKDATVRTFAWTLAILLLLLPNYGYFFQENNTYAQTSRGDKPNYRSVFTYVVKHSNPGDALVTRGFRNYYWSGSGLTTYDFGGELVKTGQAEKLSLEKLYAIMTEHPSGWVVLSENDNDYVTKDAQRFIEEGLERINAIAVRGPIGVYRWGGTENGE